MINKLPIIGWILSIVANVSLSIPFWLCWTVFGIGTKFFYWLPPVYLAPGFWECVGFFICAGIFKATLTPQIASVSQSNTNEKK